MAVDAGNDVSVRARFEGDVANEAGGQSRRPRRLPSLGAGSAHAGTSLRSEGEAD